MEQMISSTDYHFCRSVEPYPVANLLLKEMTESASSIYAFLISVFLFPYLSPLVPFSPLLSSFLFFSIFLDQVGLWQKYYAPQVRPDWGSHSWPPGHDRTFYVTETPALTTWPSVTSYPFCTLDLSSPPPPFPFSLSLSLSLLCLRGQDDLMSKAHNTVIIQTLQINW